MGQFECPKLNFECPKIKNNYLDWSTIVICDTGVRHCKEEIEKKNAI